VSLLDKIRLAFKRNESDIKRTPINVKNAETIKNFGRSKGSKVWHDYGSGYGTLANCDFAPKDITERSTFVPTDEKFCKKCAERMLKDKT
jgi:replication-associated recombination protein RarA